MPPDGVAIVWEWEWDDDDDDSVDHVSESSCEAEYSDDHKTLTFKVNQSQSMRRSLHSSESSCFSVFNRREVASDVIREALDDVHQALNQTDKVTNVAFAWVKYLVVWMRSGSGFYAGVNITIRGHWSIQVCHCASTR